METLTTLYLLVPFSMFVQQTLSQAHALTRGSLDGGVPLAGVGADFSYFPSYLAPGPDFVSEHGVTSLGLEASPGWPSNLHTASQPPSKSAQSSITALLAALSSQMFPSGLGAHPPPASGFPLRGSQFAPLIQPASQTLSPMAKALLVLQQLQQASKGSYQTLQPTPPPTRLGVPRVLGPSPMQQMALSNLFISGLEKPGAPKVPVEATPSGPPRKPGGLHPIPGLSAPPTAAPEAPVAQATRSDCDPLVDVIFALDDLQSLWLARDAIRHYITHVRPAGKARFGVMLCGADQTFYTALHVHFTGLLASLEDLQHANVTLDPLTLQQPDAPGLRSSNNPYPPRLSEDFAQTDARCLETAYYMFMYQSRDYVTRLLTAILSKDRWSGDQVVEEARYLQSFNVSMMVLAHGTLPTAVMTSLQAMASSPSLFRAVADNVTLHALPAVIADVMCVPSTGNVTVTVDGESTTVANATVGGTCRLHNTTSLERITDFGQFFGHRSDVVVCELGTRPDLHACACV